MPPTPSPPPQFSTAHSLKLFAAIIVYYHSHITPPRHRCRAGAPQINKVGQGTFMSIKQALRQAAVDSDAESDGWDDSAHPPVAPPKVTSVRTCVSPALMRAAARQPEEQVRAAPGVAQARVVQPHAKAEDPRRERVCAARMQLFAISMGKSSLAFQSHHAAAWRSPRRVPAR